MGEQQLPATGAPRPLQECQPVGVESWTSCSQNRKLLNALADVVLLAAFDLCPKSGVDDKQKQHEEHRHRVRCGKWLLVAV